MIPATCEYGGKTIHRCDGCGSAIATDYTEPLGHSWDKGTLVTNATCTGEGVMEYHCVRCGEHKIEEMLLPVIFPVLRPPVRSRNFARNAVRF